MKSLKYITCVELTEFDLIVHPKEEPTKTQLINIRPNISNDYDQYLNNFSTIVARLPSNYVAPESIALQGCYSIKTNQRDFLLKRIIEEQTTDFQEICGYCLFHLRATMDHYIPKDEYSEFSVLPRNLLPCCSRCNTIKNQYWRENNRRVFIHLYNDVIPDVRFLFGQLDNPDSTPVINFTLRNNNNTVDHEFFQVIKAHFRKLELFDLYSTGVAKAISDIQTDVKGLRRIYPEDVTTNTIQTFLLTKSADLKLRFGINYWRAIAIEILANSNPFIESL